MLLQTDGIRLAEEPVPHLPANSPSLLYFLEPHTFHQILKMFESEVARILYTRQGKLHQVVSRQFPSGKLNGTNRHEQVACVRT